MTVNTFTDAELKAHNAAIRSAALAEAVKVLDAYSEYDRSLCCDGRECGCHGSSVFDVIKHYTLALATTPPGMVCVPVEPTEAMILAGSWEVTQFQNRDITFGEIAANTYSAMIAAYGGKE